MARKPRSVPEINAGSMADIAFLLLVFFLVTTTMDIPTGLQVGLPPIPDGPPPESKQRQKNVLEVLINSRNQLLVEGDLAKISQLNEITKTHLLNEGRDPRYAESSEEAIVSLKNDRGTDFVTYVGVYNEIKRAYNEVRDEYSEAKFGKPFAKLKKKSVPYDEVKKKYPIKISEAEPEDMGGN